MSVSPSMRNTAAIVGILAVLAAGASTVSAASSQRLKTQQESATRGDSRNKPPATHSQAGATVTAASDAFDWTDAAIGAGAMLGIVLAAAGALTLARTSRRQHDRQSADTR